MIRPGRSQRPTRRRLTVAGTELDRGPAAPDPVDVDDRLRRRLHPEQLARRLQIETEEPARIFGQGQNLFHIENWPGGRYCIEAGLKLAGLYGRARRAARAIQVRHHDIVLPRLPAEFEGYTLLQLTDLHIDIAPDMCEVIGGAVNGLVYDACVLTGDYRAETYGPYEEVLKGMRRLRERLRPPVYGVLGNHDSVRMLPALEDMGIRMLFNEHTRLERGDGVIYLAGVDDPHYFRTDDSVAASAGIPPESVSLLLAHSPEIYRRAASAGFDVVLCGHTHGGQLCLPGGRHIMSNAKCPRELVAGPWTFEGLVGYTSVGCGTSVVDLRLNCSPEVTLHRLVGARELGSA